MISVLILFAGVALIVREFSYYRMKILLDKSNIVIILFSTLMVILLLMKYLLGQQKLETPLGGIIFVFWLLTFLLFSCGDIILFYFFFEFSIVPLIFMVSAIGYSLDRIKAIIYMYIYTVVFSIPALFFIFFYRFFFGGRMSFTGKIFAGIEEIRLVSLSAGLRIFFMFLIKMPIWGFHFWLPKAHVEASVQGSILLASLVLKMGVFGAWKVSISILYLYPGSWVTPILSLAALGGVIISLLCLRQTDNKISVALSSIVHIGPCLILVACGYSMSAETLFLIMLSHGFISPAMFMYIYDVYEKTKSRSLVLSLGTLKNLWVAQIMWFLICICNMGMPLTINFWGEMGFFLACFNLSVLICITALVTILTNGLYNIFLFNFLNTNTPKTVSNSLLPEYGTIKSSLIIVSLVVFYLFIDLEV